MTGMTYVRMCILFSGLQDLYAMFLIVCILIAGTRDWQCDICHKKYTTEHNLKCHKLWHDGR